MKTGKTIRHLVRFMLGLEPASTQTTEMERAALVKYAKAQHRLGEIGVYEGFTTTIIGQAMAADGVLYAIDPFFGGRFGISWGKWIARRETRKIRSPRRILFIEKLSYDALSFIEGDLDFLFIDGDHSVEGISRDWADWSKKISQGGIIALHDTRVPEHNPAIANLGSYQYFESHIKRDKRFELLEQVDSLSVLRRRA